MERNKFALNKNYFLQL